MTEKAVRFGESADLIGIVSENPAERRSVGPALIMLNAGLVHRVGPNRMHVRTAREVARAGYPVLRFDFSGIGDSPPRSDHLMLSEARPREIREAMRFLGRTRGAERFVLAGLCTGADEAFRVAVEDERVSGLVLIDPFPIRTFGWYLRHYGRRLFRLASWRTLLQGRGHWSRPGGARPGDPAAGRSPPSREESERGLRVLLERGTELLCIYTDGMRDHYNSPDQFREIFRSVSFGDALTLLHLTDCDHVFSRQRDRIRLADEVRSWLGAISASGGGDRRGAMTSDNASVPPAALSGAIAGDISL